MTERMSTWRVGDARGAGIEMGPVVDESQLQQDLRYLDVARGEGHAVVGADGIGQPVLAEDGLERIARRHCPRLA